MNTDTELCEKVQAGDRAAAASLQERHSGLVGHIIRQYNFPKTGETYQTGRIALHTAAIGFHFDAKKAFDHKAFIGYACTAIRNALLSMHDRSEKICGMKINTGRAGHKAWPKRKPLSALVSSPEKGIANDSALDELTPLPRIVCRLLAAGVDPVQRLGLYEGELERIRKRAYEEMT